jgi:hypothetical protein
MNPAHRLMYYRFAHRYLEKHFGRGAALAYRLALPPILAAGILTHALWFAIAGGRAGQVRKNLVAFAMSLRWAVSPATGEGGVAAR